MAFVLMNEQIVILDFGSQYTQVIARRIRECNVYSVILPYNTPAAEIAKLNPSGLILSGGPSSVYAPKAPLPDKGVVPGTSLFSEKDMAHAGTTPFGAFVAGAGDTATFGAIPDIVSARPSFVRC